MVEQLSAGIALTAALSESVGLAEALGAQLGAVAGLADSAAYTEALDTIASMAAELGETVTLEEALLGLVVGYAIGAAFAALATTVGVRAEAAEQLTLQAAAGTTVTASGDAATTLRSTLTMATLDIGDDILLTANFTTAAGALTDPGDVTCIVLAPDGTQTTYEYNPGAIVRASLGVFTLQIPLDQAGKYQAKWSSTAPAKAVEFVKWTVARPKF